MSSSSPTPASSPAKPLPLHNFELPELKWNKAGQPSSLKKRRRLIKLHSQRPNAPPAPSLPPSPSQESTPVTPPPAQSPLKDSATLQSRDCLMKHSPARGESSKPSPNREELKNESAGGDELGKVLSLLRDKSRSHFQKRDTPSGSEGLKKGKGVFIEYRRKSFAFSSLKIGGNFEQTEKIKKVEKISKPIENDESVNKKPKIMIKIKSSKEEEEEKNSNLGLLKTPIVDEPAKTEDGKTEEPREEEAKIDNDVDDEARIWDLRPRKRKFKSKSHKADIDAEKANAPKVPEKSKAQTPTKNAKAKEGKSSGGEKKEKKDKDEKKEKGEKSEKEEKERKKLSINISLTKREIEEDIFALTGAKPARRPRKRPKNVQKQVDFVFPGQWLVSITPESYKVSEISIKG